MNPHDRPAEAERIGGEVSEILEAIRGPEPETDWRKGISKNAWALLGLCSVLIASCGVLVGRLTDNEARERSALLRAIASQSDWNYSMSARVERLEDKVARYGDDSKEALQMMRELTQERYENYRAAAIRRGDDVAERRLTKKIEALKAGAQGSQP